MMKELSKQEIFRRLAESPDGVELAVWDGKKVSIRKIVGHDGEYACEENLAWNHAGLPTASMWIEASDMPDEIKKQWHENARFPDQQCDKEWVFDCETFCNWSGTDQGASYWTKTRIAFLGKGEYPEPWKAREEMEPSDRDGFIKDMEDMKDAIRRFRAKYNGV